MSIDRLKELERRLFAALAAALKNATHTDPAWRKFKASVDHGKAQASKPQNGTSSPGSEGSRAGDPGP